MTWRVRARIRGRGGTFQPIRFRTEGSIPVQDFFYSIKRQKFDTDSTPYYCVRWAPQQGTWVGVFHSDYADKDLR